MSRPRRSRLHALGNAASRPAAPRSATHHLRCSDLGGPISAAGARRAPSAAAAAAMALACLEGVPTTIVDAEEWGWPPAAPSSSSWPAPGDSDNDGGVLAGGRSLTIETDDTRPTPPLPPAAAKPQAPPSAVSASPATPPPVSCKPIPPLGDSEAEDDVAAILREKGMTPTPAPVVNPPPPPSSPSGATAAESTPAPAEDRHAIFGQLGRSMPHATAFQLGRFELDRHLDMLEADMSWHPPAPLAPSGARDIHDLDVLSELASLSEAAGVQLRHGEDGAAFLAKLARAQGVSLAGLEAAHADDDDGTEDEFAATEEAASEEAASDEEHSPWGAHSDDAAVGESGGDLAEDDNG